MSVEPILSDELLAELGNDPNVVLVGKKRKQELSEEDKKRKYIPEDELKKFKKLSKKEQKRVEQREKKKERASRQGEYMDIIKANEISDQQRDMLLSSRQLNHTATLREQLTMLLKKEKAGIKLSEEELDLLYPNRHQHDEDNGSDSDDNNSLLGINNSISNNKSTQQSTVPDTNTVETKEGTSDTLFSFSSLFSPPVAKNTATGHDSDSSVAEKKKDKKKKKKKAQQTDEVDQSENPKTEAKFLVSLPASTSKAAETNAVVPSIPPPAAEKKSFSAAGLGKTLLAQFSKIKEQKASTETKIDEKDSKVSTIFSPEFDYNPDAHKTFTSTLPVVPDAIKEFMALEEAKAASVAPKPVLREIYFIDRRHMSVERPHQVAIDRMNLPVCQMEQEIVEAVNNHDVIILCGETGSGKSTQVPQFLYEAGYAQDEDHLIGIAQPRRVAVTSTAERVNFEMGCTLPELAHQKKLNKHKKNMRKRKEKEIKRKAAFLAEGKENGEALEEELDNDDDLQEDEDKQLAKYYPNGRKVGYQIRYDSTTVGSDTRIKFMTDGILLREISQDLLLRKYSVIILDEAHERNVNTDILLGMISRAIPLRKEIAAKEFKKWQRMSVEQRANFSLPLAPLKLIIMSATLRVDDFCQERLFNPLPPIIKVEARQYPVTNHFAKRTETRDYLQEAFKKTCQIHERLPPGGVLMFLTGKREILFMCKRLQRALATKKPSKHRSSNSNYSNKFDSTKEEEAPFEAMLADLQQSRGTSSKSNKKDKDNNDNYKEGNEDDNEDMKVGFDGDEIDEIEAGSEQGEDDYDAMNWNDKLSSHDDDDSENNNNDEDSVISDIDDEDYVPPVNNNNNFKQNRHSKIEDEVKDADKEAARLRKDMLASVLGTNKKVDKSTNGSDSEPEKDPSQKNATDAEDKDNVTENDVTFDPESSRVPTAEDMPKLKPWILPLYAMMPAHLQKKVFAPVPAGYRLIVVATNVAETSITIPGIRYVVDCGRGKEKVLASGSVNAQDAASSSAQVYEAGITRYEVKWISKASSDQRAGRAGRTGPGHCYRLYSSNFYNEHMQAFMPPEINVTPLEDIVLHMLSLGISEIESFPFPSNPPRAAVHAAVTLLKNLGAIQRDTVATRAKEREARLWTLLNQTKKDLLDTKNINDDHKITLGQLSPLGKMLRWFPIHPRFAKMLVVATQTTVNRMNSSQVEKDDENNSNNEYDESKLRLLSQVLTMVATLTERSVFVFDDMDENEDDDSDNDEEDEEVDDSADEDGDDFAGKKRRKHSQQSSLQKKKKTKTMKTTNNSKLLQGRKLFYHTSGDVMARVRATGAYLFTLYSTLARQRQERLAAKEKETLEREEKQRQLIENNDISNINNNDTVETVSGTIKTGIAVTYQKWEYDLANQDAAVLSLCQTFHLHLGTLQRIVDLRNQLQHIMESVFPRFLSHCSKEDAHIKVTFPVLLDPPNNAEEIALRQILVSGYCDQIAKRTPFAAITAFLERQQQLQVMNSHNNSSNEKPINYLSRRRKFTAYLSGHPSLQTTGPVYLHPTSNMYAHDITQASETLPEYICYTHMMKNQRGDSLYLTNVTVIQPQWLATIALDCPLVTIRHSDVLQQLDLASTSAPLVKKAITNEYHQTVKDGLAPYYDCTAEQMMLYVKPRYGVHLWALPSVSLSMRYVLEHWTDSATNAAGDSNNKQNNSALPVGYRSEDLEYRWFARCLLFGQIALPIPIPQLQRACLNDVHCLQQQSPHPKVLSLLHRLIEANVADRRSLLQEVQRRPHFLAKEIELLLKKEHQRPFRIQWQRLSAFLDTAVAPTAS